MVSFNKLKKLYGGNVCRQCINKTYSIHLLHTDCVYGFMYPAKCACCREMKNIVTGMKLSGVFKSLFKRAEKVR